MNRKEYMKWCFHARSGSNLTNELFTLNAIDEYESGCYNDIVRSDDFQSLLADIRKSDDINEYNEENVGNRLNEHDFDKQRVLRDITYYIVGGVMSDEDIDLDWLEEKEEVMGHAFWLALSINKDTLVNMVESLDAKAILRASRDIVNYDDNLYSWCRKNIRDDMPPEAIIKLINQYNDGAYISLRYGTDILAWILRRDRQWDLWMQMLYKLKYFPLQGAMIYGLHTIEEINTVINNVFDNNDRYAKVLLWLLRERLFAIASEEHLNLKRNQENDILDITTRELLSGEIDKFDKSLESTIFDCFKILINTFGDVDSLNWYSRKESMTQNVVASIMEANTASLSVVDKLLTAEVRPSDINWGELSTDAQIYLSEILCTQSAEADLCKDYILNICNSIYQDSTFITPQLTEKSLNRMRCVYRCLEAAGIDGLELTMCYRPKEQGENEEYFKQLFQCQRADSYWLSMLMLRAEHTKEESVLREILEFIYRIPIKEVSLTNNYYFLPLYIGEMIVTQVIPSFKDEYEADLIASKFSLTMILRVLTANKGQLSHDNTDILMKRVSCCWDKECQHLTRFDKELLKHLQHYLEKVNDK